MKPLALASCASLLCFSGWSSAAPRTWCSVEGVWCAPVVPNQLARERTHYFSVSLGAEQRGAGISGDESFAALATTLRLSAFAPYLQLMAKPPAAGAGYEDSRVLVGTGLRAYVRALGTELSYGIGVAIESRFEDHFWLAYATPLELSAVLWRRRSLEVELFAGLRGAFTGDLINSFLLDPNGFHNEQAEAELQRATHQDAWHGFLRLMISRRID